MKSKASVKLSLNNQVLNILLVVSSFQSTGSIFISSKNPQIPGVAHFSIEKSFSVRLAFVISPLSFGHQHKQPPSRLPILLVGKNTPISEFIEDSSETVGRNRLDTFFHSVNELLLRLGWKVSWKKLWKSALKRRFCRTHSFSIVQCECWWKANPRLGWILLNKFVKMANTPLHLEIGELLECGSQSQTQN